MCFNKPCQLCVTVILFLVLLSSACTNSGEPTGWQKEGLLDMQVHMLETNEKRLLVGTDHGLFGKEVGTKPGNFILNGLAIDSARVIDVAMVNQERWLSVVKYSNFDSGNPMLFITDNRGKNWTPNFSNAIEEVDRFSISAIELKPTDQDEILVYRAHIISSVDGGQTWKVIFDKGSRPEFLAIDLYHSNQIWAGGSTAIFAPYLAKSADGGETWEQLNNKISTGSDAKVHDVILHPDDGNSVIAAMGGLRRSTDGGQNWQTLQLGQFGVINFTHSIHRGTIYASGGNANGTVFFASSSNFGDSWEMIEYEKGPTDVIINDMVAVEAGGREVLYLGTNQGVYSYWFKD